MTRLALSTLAGAVAAALAATALADGGPSPGFSQGWDGIRSPGADVRYVTMPAGRSTVLAAVNVDGGRVVRFRSLKGIFGIPLVTYDGTTGGLSADGRLLVLGEALRGGAALNSESRFALLGTRSFRVRGRITLRGDFSFDALSPDARILYLIEHVSARDFTRYRVRAYDLRAGRLLDRVVADRRSSETTMNGYPVTRAASDDGGWVYTLYRNDGGTPFIHALDTRARRAVCIDLPWRGSQDRLWGMKLAMTDNRHLVLRRKSGATAFVVDTQTFEVRAA